MLALISVAIGGAIGAIMRWQISMQFATLANTFNWGTLLCNVLGSLCIGVFFALLKQFQMIESTRHFLQIGLLGSFTSFSTVSLEVFRMFETNMLGAITYAFGSITTCVAGCALGFLLISTLRI